MNVIIIHKYFIATYKNDMVLSIYFIPMHTKQSVLRLTAKKTSFKCNDVL